MSSPCWFKGNGHKWLYSPKGSAVLWVRGDRQNLIEPTVISWEGVGVPNTHYQMAFAYTGTASYSPCVARVHYCYIAACCMPRVSYFVRASRFCSR